MFKYSILSLVFAFNSLMATTDVPHLELELMGADYQQMEILDNKDAGDLKPVMNMGKRSLDWLIFINKHRPDNEKISLSSAGTQPAYPIETPRFSNPTLILEAFETLKTEMPEWMKAIIFDGASFTENPPVEDEEFIKWGLRVDGTYARASRWLLQENNLWIYSMKKKSDVRGYYHLIRTDNLEQKLNSWNSLSQTEQEQFKKWLVGLCYHTATTESGCRSELDQLISEPTKIYGFYKEYLKGGAEAYQSFYDIKKKRSDVDWTSEHADNFILPFSQPEKPEVEQFLIKNIEEEWQWSDWQLSLKFLPKVFGMAHIKFVPGATPNVNTLAGDTITMDANKPLSEYDVQWTIRHEFGHVIGFPDCYVEFYDSKDKVMVSYQLDITNLMCSKRGHIKDLHYQELKKAYFKEGK